MKSSIKVSNDGNTIHATGDAANELFKAMTGAATEPPAPKKEEPEGCKCLEIIRKNLEETHKANVDFELKTMINMETLTLKAALPPLAYSYMAGKKRKKSYVTFNFCPFCGKRL